MKTSTPTENSEGKTFEAWLAELNTTAAQHVEGYEPSGPNSLTADTGEDCWRMFYDDGYTPYTALAEEWSND